MSARSRSPLSQPLGILLVIVVFLLSAWGGYSLVRWLLR
jgi:hypothetical protein